VKSESASSKPEKTGEALRRFAKTHQRPWPDIIREYAERGYSWADVADIIGVERNNLAAYCHYRKLSFPWQGQKSGIQRDRQARLWEERGMAGNAHAKRYTVRGFTGTMGEIAEHFGVCRQTIYTRMRRYGMALEQAATRPVMTPAQSGQLGQDALKRRGTRSQFWKHEGALHLGHLTATADSRL